MAQLRQYHPWNPGYALPKNVRDEPFGQGALVTGYTPRGTISQLQPNWFEDGNAIQAAAIVAKEAAGMGSLGGLGGHHGSLGCTSLSRASLSGSSLARTGMGAASAGGAPIIAGGSNDPIANFGRQGAAAVLGYIRSVPVANRSAAMKAFLDSLDPGLWKSVADKATQLQKEKNYSATVALEKALQIMLADRLLNQFAKIGTTGRAPVSGLLGLIDPQQRVVALEGTMEALGWTIGGAIKSGVSAAASGVSSVASGVKSTVNAVVNAPGQVVSGVKQGATAVAGAVKDAASAVKNAAANAIDKLGQLACKTVGNPATAQVAGSVPHPYAQAAAVGAQVAQGLCGNGVSPVTEQPYTPASTFPTVPVLIGGAAVVGLLAFVAFKK